MNAQCPRCGTAFEPRENLETHRVECPHCGEAIAIEDALDEVEFVEDGEQQPIQPQKRKERTAYITCPECDEKNRVTARRCRACGERLSPDELSGVWRAGNILVMSKGAELPYRCVKTNEPAEVTLRRKLSWHSPLVFLTIFCGLLIYVILAIILSKRADIEVPISRRIQKRRFMAILGGWLFGLAGLGVLVLGIALADSPDQMWKDIGPIMIIGGLVFALISAITGAMIAGIVAPSKITDTHIWLRGVHRDYLDQLPEWPGE
jgi:predicted RNA-binding Zn-ribbon protein involved in translation (DUF1610 family)